METMFLSFYPLWSSSICLHFSSRILSEYSLHFTQTSLINESLVRTAYFVVLMYLGVVTLVDFHKIKSRVGQSFFAIILKISDTDVSL